MLDLNKSYQDLTPTEEHALMRYFRESAMNSVEQAIQEPKATKTRPMGPQWEPRGLHDTTINEGYLEPKQVEAQFLKAIELYREELEEKIALLSEIMSKIPEATSLSTDLTPDNEENLIVMGEELKNESFGLDMAA